jgi:hypothetical protein
MERLTSRIADVKMEVDHCSLRLKGRASRLDLERFEDRRIASTIFVRISKD